jgi:hypothetical protein
MDCSRSRPREGCSEGRSLAVPALSCGEDAASRPARPRVGVAASPADGQARCCGARGRGPLGCSVFALAPSRLSAYSGCPEIAGQWVLQVRTYYRAIDIDIARSSPAGAALQNLSCSASGSACCRLAINTMKLLLLTLLLSLAVDSANSCKSDLDCAHVTSPRPSRRHSRSANHDCSRTQSVNTPAALAS